MRAGATTALALAVAATVGLTGGCGGPQDETKGGAHLTRGRTLRFFHAPGDPGGFQPIFHGKTEFERGDAYIKWDGFKSRGLGATYCVISQQRPSRTFSCSRVYVLPAGQIVAVGDYDGSPDGDAGTLPIVGGTGAFAGARGSVTTHGGRRGEDVTIRLR
jgi:hypothetical protein